ncbi:PAS domain-containing sensor histidine kinase [Spirosoma sp.]|uniref:PAS domain-containing sensor histidine kinase n=1 Tax=Spirosoma sp. TaxID=1899569 RepID=UPI0026197EC9|nr:PAS domain-containing sensor histidine kinase [Spirosoma sp.]MCX6215654.1 PAS domain S-box protein [Spirosoma sp.]
MTTNDHLLLQYLPQAILQLDPHGHITYANPAAVKLTQYSIQELVNQPIARLYSIDGDSIKASYELSIARKTGLFHTQGWRTRKDRTTCWCEISYTSLYDEGNSFLGYCCTLTDQSIQKQHQQQLRQQEERYRLMVEGVKDYAIFMLDTGGHILTWNEGAQRIKGYAPGEIIGKHFSSFYTAQDLADNKPARELTIAIQTGTYEEEGWRIKKNGSVFWANVVITALFSEANQHIGFSKVTRDLTQRKQTQEALRQSEERYRSLVEQVADYGIFMMDEKGRVINWNEGARRISGYTQSEITGKYFSIFYPPEDILNDKPAHELRVALETGKYEEEGWRLRKDGTLFWASIVITALYNSVGLHIGFSKVTRDLTERKQAEESLRESYDRYRSLTVELQRSNEDLQRFAHVASHDLKEPARKVKLFSHRLKAEFGSTLPEQAQQFVAKIERSADRMLTMIQGVLSYSSLNALPQLLESLDLNGILEQIEIDLDVLIGEKQARILKQELPSIEGVPVLIYQLFYNLLNNALKFTKADEPAQITVSLADETDEQLVSIRITDTGIGFDEQHADKVFEPFTRLHTKDVYEGTGLGLALCKKIVERHGGAIGVKSTINQGTTFLITLPRSQKSLRVS